MTSDDGDLDSYRRLQQHLDGLPVGYPKTKSGLDIRILRRIFTPLEAKIATKLVWSYEPAQVIHGRARELGITPREFEEILDKMVSKGEINFKKEGGKRLYAAAQFAVGVHEYQVKRMTAEYYKDIVQYGAEAWIKALVSSKIPQVRTVPLDVSLTPAHYAPRYDDVKRIIQDAEGPFSVTECVCRKGMGLIGTPCKRTSRKETCLGLGGPVIKTYLVQGWGRELNREEVLEVLQRNEEEGLVLQAGNSERPEFICSCCSCCCGLLISVSLQPNPVAFVSSNYHAQVDADLCAGCKTCVARCQMGAVKVVDDVAQVNLKRCIGCGICVPTCETKAMRLVKKDKQIAPPRTADELYERILEGKNEVRQKAV